MGLAVMGATLLAALLAAPAVAQDAEEVEAPVQASALVSYPLNDALPDTLMKGFPPQVVCVIRPDLCPEEAEPVRGPIGEGLAKVDDNEQTSPLQPANPDGLTISYTGGAPRYASAVQVELPTVPDGEQVDQFVLSIPQGQPSFSFDSPAFRRVVSAVIQTAGSQDPAVFQEQMAKALEEEPASQPQLGIEACPLTTAIPEDAQAPRSVPVSEISEEDADGEQQPAIDCLYGSNGTFDDKAGTWSFDLTFAAQAWADGTLGHHGVLLRPTGAPNLAFGDPDTSTNAQVVLDVSAPPTATFASSAPPPPPEPLAPLAPPPSQSPTSASGTASGGTTSMSPPSSSSAFSSPPASSSMSAPSTPTAEVAAPQTAPSEPQPEAVALDTTPAGDPGSPTSWTTWLLVLPFAGGAWLTARSLGEEVVAGASRGGALTRLVGGDGSPPA